MTVSLDNEVFALRDHESMQLFDAQPNGRFLMVMARTVEMPSGPRSAVRAEDSAPVQQAAIIACEWGQQNQCWQWMQLSPPSKERIADLLFDNGAEKDVWYFLAITDLIERP